MVVSSPSINTSKTISPKRVGGKTLIITLIRTVSICTKLDPIRMIALVSIKLIQSIIPIYQMTITEEMVDKFSQLVKYGEAYFRGATLVLFSQLSLFLISIIARSVASLLMRQTKFKIKYHFDSLIARKSSEISFSNYYNSEFYDQLRRASSGHSQRSVDIIEYSLHLVQIIITIISYIIVLFYFNYILSICIICLVIPVIASNMIVGKLKYLNFRSQTSTYRKAKYFYDILTSREAAKEMRVFNLYNLLQARWSTSFWKASKEQISVETKGAWFGICIEGLDSLVTVFVIGILFWLGSFGRVTIGQYVSISQAFTTANSQMHNLARNISRLHESSLFLSDTFSYLDFSEESGEFPGVAFPVPLQHGITVKSISFKYSNSTKLTLNKVSFQIRSGNKVAIVGENGAGKSTLVNCLLGLYRPQEGDIYYDQISLKEIDIRSLREHTSVAFQDFVKYQMSLSDNIGLSNNREIDDRRKIETAAARAGVNDFLDRLSNGFDTMLGPAFDGGVELSGGQWQRVSLSRALFKETPILILDEPTSALDPIAEREFYQTFLSLPQTKTAIFISHRLGVCRHADLILVLKDGAIVEQGNHDELMKLSGVYSKMYMKQTEMYNVPTNGAVQ